MGVPVCAAPGSRRHSGGALIHPPVGVSECGCAPSSSGSEKDTLVVRLPHLQMPAYMMGEIGRTVGRDCGGRALAGLPVPSENKSDRASSGAGDNCSGAK